MRPGGLYTYGYNRKTNAVSEDYNITRHAGVMISLYQLAGETGDDKALSAAEHGLSFVHANLLRNGDWTAFAEPGEDARLGASGLLAIALIQRRLATGDDSEDDLILGLARFLASQQQADGSVLGRWSRATESAVPGEYATFGTGQALWTFALLDKLFPGEGWDEPARRLARYVATRRDDVEGYVLTFPDHWSAYALAELGPGELGEPEIAYARELAGILGLNSRLESQSGQGGLNRIFRGEPASGAGLGTVTEGLAALWRLSIADPRLADLTDNLSARLRCTAGRAVERQIDPVEAEEAAAPPARARRLVHGGRLHADGPPAPSALRTARNARGAGSGVGAVTFAFLLLALVASANPCRVRLVLPERREAVALGALIALGSAAGVAAVGGAFLDALDITPETFRLAAAVVLALEGARALVLARPAREPELGGLGAALVPVAFPLLLTPGVVMLALTAGGDDDRGRGRRRARGGLRARPPDDLDSARSAGRRAARGRRAAPRRGGDRRGNRAGGRLAARRLEVKERSLNLRLR